MPCVISSVSWNAPWVRSTPFSVRRLPSAATLLCSSTMVDPGATVSEP
jgi:hypothetical protein